MDRAELAFETKLYDAEAKEDHSYLEPYTCHLLLEMDMSCITDILGIGRQGNLCCMLGPLVSANTFCGPL
jgi:hypothetical protein